MGAQNGAFFSCEEDGEDGEDGQDWSHATAAVLAEGRFAVLPSGYMRKMARVLGLLPPGARVGFGATLAHRTRSLYLRKACTPYLLSSDTTMCIISGDVKEVSDTEIFAAPCLDAAGTNKPRQLTAYQNKVTLGATGQGAAMILPVPCGAAAVRMVELPPGLFEDLRKEFKRIEPVTKGGGSGMVANSYSVVQSAAPLEVHQCGRYDYSIVPDAESFARLRSDAFVVDPAVVALLRQSYSRGFCFLVCAIKRSGAYSPVAYVHDLPWQGDRLFLPTRHYHGSSPLHDGGLRPWSLTPDDASWGVHHRVGTKDAAPERSPPPGHEKFDHAIYTVDDGAARLFSQAIPVPDLDGRGKLRLPPPWGGATNVGSADLPVRGVAWGSTRRRKLQGYFPNDDIWLRCDGNIREMMVAAPAAGNGCIIS